MQKTTYAADVDKLRGIIAERKLTQKRLAKHLEMDVQTFANRMKSGKFTNDEITKITLFLEIEDFVSVFFPYLKKEQSGKTNPNRLDFNIDFQQLSQVLPKTIPNGEVRINEIRC